LSVTGRIEDFMPESAPDRPLPLAGIKVVEVATLFAAPLAATYLADYGADVIKVEHPYWVAA